MWLIKTALNVRLVVFVAGGIDQNSSACCAVQATSENTTNIIKNDNI